MLNARSKGQRGEREFCKWIQTILDLDYLPERNLDQVRSGGADVMCIPGFKFEVKRVQTLALRKWWEQVSVAYGPGEPVVMYRQNHKKWRALISAKHIGLEHGYIALGSLETIAWLKMMHAMHLRARSRAATTEQAFDTYVLQ